MDTGASGLVDIVVGLQDMIFSDRERPATKSRNGERGLRGLRNREGMK